MPSFKIPPPPSSYSGFSLVELSVVLAIIALVGGAALTLGSAQQESAKAEVTKERLDAIEAALVVFAKKGNYLPCPARPSLAPGNASFGASANCAAAAPADIATTTGSGQTIWIGMVPTRSLSLPDEYAYDGWYNRFKYAVIKDLTVAASDTITDYDTALNAGTGIIQIVDGGSTPHQIPSTDEKDIVAYAVVSHGKDGKGAYKKVGGTAGTCTAGYLDSENCDNDAVFVDTFFNDSTVTANYYDDYARWALLPKLMTEAALEDWTAPPPSVSLNATISAGTSHACAIKDDGTVWCWGMNAYGQLGDNTLIDRHTPVQAIGVMNAIDIGARDQQTLALKSDGSLWWWPNGIGGLLPEPEAGISGLAQISAQTDYACGLKSDGTLWCRDTWGDATWYDRNITDAVQSGIGHGTFACALKSDGTVWCRGEGDAGELGNGTCNDSATPVQVSGLTGVVSIAPATPICAVKSDGTVWCWGETIMPPGTCSATQVAGLTDVTMVRVGSGGYHACALKSDGTVWCFGVNTTGQFGDGNTNIWWTGTPVQASITGVVEITAGGIGNATGLTCARKADDTIWCWGDNLYGQCGDNTSNNDRHSPVQVQNFP